MSVTVAMFIKYENDKKAETKAGDMKHTYTAASCE